MSRMAPLLLSLLLLAVAPLLFLAHHLRGKRERGGQASGVVGGAGGAEGAADAASQVHVVVVGGSFAGLTFCHRLLHLFASSSSSSSSPPSVRLTLVEPRDFFEYTPGILRAVVRPSHHPSLLTPLSSLPLLSSPAFRLVQGRAESLSLDEGEVRVSGASRPIPFDFLVLAVGSGYDASIKPSQEDEEETSTVHRLRAVERLHSALCSSSNILIVGAGLVGVVTPHCTLHYTPLPLCPSVVPLAHPSSPFSSSLLDRSWPPSWWLR